MGRYFRVTGILLMVLSIIAIVIGIVFVYQGWSKNNLIVERMRVEKVTLALDPANPSVTTEITNGAEAQKAADIIAGHRRSIAPTYQDLLGGGQFDPTNAKDLTYAQAMNLENYLYLAVTAFGLINVVLGAGAFMIVTGIGMLLIGLVFIKMPVRLPQGLP